MNFLLQKILLHTKDNNLKNRHIFFKLGCILMVAFLIACLPADSVSAASGLKLYYYSTKKSSTYTDKQVKVTYNDKKISVNSTPGILVNGVALVSYKDIFDKSNIAANCVYNKAKGTVTISKNGTTIVMTIGSKKANVNGKAVTMSVAPIKIKYLEASITKILVPSRFVSETLGYKYTWSSAKSTVSIVKNQEIKSISSLSLSYDNGKKFEYTGTQGSVVVDGTIIEPGNMPSIINNNTAMLRAKRVFADSDIGANYKYNKADKSITLSTNGRELVMKIASSVGYLNGKAIVLDRAPMIVTNFEAKQSYVMVPGNITASSLGYDYTWDKQSKTSIIKTSSIIEEPDTSGEDVNTAPELGDSGVNNTGLLLQEWIADEALIGKSIEQHILNQDASTTVDSGIIYSVTRDYINSAKNAETYVIMATTPFGKITSSKNGDLISINASNRQSIDYTFQVFGSMGNYVNTINMANNPAELYSSIDFSVLTDEFSYDLTLSEDKMSLYVTVYVNSLNAVLLGTNDSGDYLTLTGIDPLKVEISEVNGMYYLDIPYTASGIGDQYTAIAGSKLLDTIYVFGSLNKTQIILGHINPCSYMISEEGNRYTILFNNTSSVETPTVPTIPGTPERPEIPGGTVDPAVILPGDYEIMIPRPAGISREMISDEDHYYSNQFSIRIPGDFTSYLLYENQIIWSCPTINDVSVSLNSYGETEIKVSTSRLQGYEFVMDENYIYINVGNPREIYPNIVVLDPGHGGPANGAQYFNTKEKNLNLKILYNIGINYFNSDTSRLKVYYTRMSDVDLSLKERAAYADKMGADLFVSLHMNASTAKAANGTEVYYATNNNSMNSAGLNSKAMATLFVNNITSAMGTYNRGAKAEKYTVVYRNTVPAVLIELGFMSNSKDFAKISDSIFQDNSVRVIYETLLQIFATYPTGR
ncbi:MAG TPA: N-acetylmuramoyl-L-alanine amidase [Mobilitalea sp.]|nr:N-acetylmuramoyl-L-alanine amidase [Mobilitalea sp.]